MFHFVQGVNDRSTVVACYKPLSVTLSAADAFVEVGSLRVDVITAIKAYQRLVDTQQHVQQQSAYRDGPWPRLPNSAILHFKVNSGVA